MNIKRNLLLGLAGLIMIISACNNPFFPEGKDKEIKPGLVAPPFKVDLLELPKVKNKAAFSKAWDDLLIELPASALPSDFSKYTRFTITCKYYDATGEEIPQGDSNAMVSMIYDLNGDIRDLANGPGPNTPVKEFNVGGYSGRIHKDIGIIVTFSQPPQAVLFQNYSGSKVAFIELTSMVFHNGNYKSE